MTEFFCFGSRHVFNFFYCFINVTKKHSQDPPYLNYYRETVKQFLSYGYFVLNPLLELKTKSELIQCNNDSK